MMTICIGEIFDDIHPCTTRPPNIEDKTFPKLFQNDIYKLMNICNPTCYKIYVDALKKLCMYGFLQPLINEIHFNVEGSRFTCVSNFLYVFVTFQYFQMPEKITYFH